MSYRISWEDKKEMMKEIGWFESPPHWESNDKYIYATAVKRMTDDEFLNFIEHQSQTATNRYT